MTAFGHAIKGGDYEVIYALLKRSLPFQLSDPSDERVSLSSRDVIIPIDSIVHNYAWAIIVQNDKWDALVKRILEEFSDICLELVEAKDETGRSLINIASSLNQRLLLHSKYLFHRYEFKSNLPHYKTATCLIHLATDHDENGVESNCALKFMKNKDQYLAEINAREDGNFDSKFVLGILKTYDGTIDEDVGNELTRRKIADYPFVIVMPLAERTLQEIINQGKYCLQKYFILTISLF